MNYENSKLYIVVREEVDSFMVPTLVAHTILNADRYFTKIEDHLLGDYLSWKTISFKKVVLKVNEKEWMKIIQIPFVFLGHENTQLHGKPSCAIIPVMDEYPNVVRYAKTWKP